MSPDKEIRREICKANPFENSDHPFLPPLSL